MPWVGGIPHWAKYVLAIYLHNCNKSIEISSLLVHILRNYQALFTATSNIYEIKHQYRFYPSIATLYFVTFWSILSTPPMCLL